MTLVRIAARETESSGGAIPMRRFLAALVLTIPLACAAGDDIDVPEGFVLQRLVETDGQIARPKDWFFTSEGTPSGWMWTLSAEDPTKGPYDTGMRIQMIIGIEKEGRSTREEFARGFMAEKRASAEVLRDCSKSDVGEFYRLCLEVLEEIPSPDGSTTFRIIYSVMWGKKLDVVVVSIFGAPPAEWEAAAPIADAMAQFQLIGPNFGK